MHQQLGHRHTGHGVFPEIEIIGRKMLRETCMCERKQEIKKEKPNKRKCKRLEKP